MSAGGIKKKGIVRFLDRISQEKFGSQEKI